MIAHEVRARLHATQLHLTFLERTLRDADPDILEAVKSAADELRQLEQLVLAHLLAASEGTS